MSNTENRKTEAVSQKEKDIAISILNGMSIPKCADKFKEDKFKCKTIVNHFCMKSNYFFYEELKLSLFESPPINKLRKHSKKFIKDSKKIEHITYDSLIWVLPDVPVLTLKAIWNRKKHKIRTIKDLLEYSQRDLLRFPCLGKVGLKKLILSLNRYGFSIRKD